MDNFKTSLFRRDILLSEALTDISILSHDAAYENDIVPCIEIDKPPVVYKFCNIFGTLVL